MKNDEETVDDRGRWLRLPLICECVLHVCQCDAFVSSKCMHRQLMCEGIQCTYVQMYVCVCVRVSISVCVYILVCVCVTVRACVHLCV